MEDGEEAATGRGVLGSRNSTHTGAETEKDN